MKEIANLARIVTSRGLIIPPLVDLESKRSNKEVLLIETLVANPNLTLLQGVKALYGANSLTNRSSFRRLVSRVQERLLNHLYFLDHSDERHLVSRRYEMECLEILHKATVLYSEGEYILSERLLRKSLELAQEGDFTQYAIQAAQMLRTIYSEQRQTIKYKKMAKQIAALQRIQALEQEGDRIYADTRHAMAHTVVTKQAILPKLPGYIAELEALHRRAKTFNTFNFLYQLQLAYAELKGDYGTIVTIATKAATKLESGKVNARRFDQRLNQFVIIYAYLQSQQPLEGLRWADAYAQNFHPTSSNWLYFHEHHWLLAMHARHYTQAWQLMEQATESAAFSKLREAARQRWELYDAYLDFVSPRPRPNVVQERQREQLILTLPAHRRDKRGHHVAMLVLQILYFLRQQSLEDVMVRSERLRKYRQRNMREITPSRTQVFLRLLHLVVECNFDPARVERRSKKWLQRLRDTPTPGGAYAETEIIPYENLWAMVLDLVRTWDSQVAHGSLKQALAVRKPTATADPDEDDDEVEDGDPDEGDDSDDADQDESGDESDDGDQDESEDADNDEPDDEPSDEDLTDTRRKLWE